MKFDTMKNGYNRYQVDDAIVHLKEEKESLKSKLDAYISQNCEDDQKFDTLQEKYALLLNDITIREQAADEIAQIALKEANSVIRTANSNADTIVKEALLNAKEILLNVSKLGLEAQEIKENLNNQLTQLGNAIDGFSVPPVPNSELLKKCDE